MMSRVAVKPSLLKWARNRARLEVRDLAAKFPKYGAWEQGEAQPTFKQLESFARATATPFGYLFLDEPPIEALHIPDFRTIRSEAVGRPSPELLETVQLMQRRQDWMRDFLKEEGQRPLAFVGSSSLRSNPDDVAATMRETLGLRDGWAQRVTTWDAARSFLRQAIEDVGVLVVINGVVGNNTHRPLDPQEFRGFVLSDDLAPLVFVNGSDAKAAQVFTMAHELAHVWIGQSALFDLPRLLPGINDVERFCNKAAAEFLVPKAELLAAWREHGDTTEPFSALARQFKVSSVVVALRSLELGLIDRGRFIEFYDIHMAEFGGRGITQESSGGNFWNTQTFRVGDRFARAVIGATKEGRVLYRDAYALLGLRGKTFDTCAKRLNAPPVRFVLEDQQAS